MCRLFSGHVQQAKYRCMFNDMRDTFRMPIIGLPIRTYMHVCLFCWTRPLNNNMCVTNTYTCVIKLGHMQII